jgi:hypothetical protein
MLCLILNFILQKLLFDDILINLFLFLVLHFRVIDVLRVFFIVINHMVLIDYLANTILATCVCFCPSFLIDFLADWHLIDISLL